MLLCWDRKSTPDETESVLREPMGAERRTRSKLWVIWTKGVVALRRGIALSCDSQSVTNHYLEARSEAVEMYARVIYL